MFPNKNMSYLEFGKNNTAARPGFPLNYLFENISVQTESSEWKSLSSSLFFWRTVQGILDNYVFFQLYMY